MIDARGKVGSAFFVEIKPDSDKPWQNEEPQVIARANLDSLFQIPRTGETVKLSNDLPLYVVHDVTWDLTYGKFNEMMDNEFEYPRVIIQVMGREAYQDMVKKRLSEMTQTKQGAREV